MIKLQSIQTLLTQLSKRERTILYGVVFFVSLTILDRLIVSPIASKLQSLDKETKERESNIRKNLRILAQKDRILAESSKYDSFFSSAKTEEEETTVLLKDIENLANKNSVYLIDLKPAGSKDIGPSRKFMVTLNCEAQVEQLTSFMYAIENSDKLLTIEKYQISPKSKESSVARCSMSIAKIILP